jgi:hypothetical protein
MPIEGAGGNKRMKRTLLLVAALLVASCAFAQNTSMYFNGQTQGAIYCPSAVECVYTGFFDGSINGVNVGPGQPGGPGMISDDYNDNVYEGQHWSASGVQVSTLNSSNIGQTLFGGGQLINGYAGVQIYAQLAYLVNQMVSVTNTTLLSAYSQALWYITGGLSWSSINSTAQNLVTNAIGYAKGNNFSLSQYINLWLYTPTARGPEQAEEMWGLVPVPEGGSAFLYLLLAGVSCLGSVAVRRRERLRQVTNS